MKHNIENAIYTIQIVANLGFEGLKAFTLTREKPDILEQDPYDETYDEYIDRLSSVCWMGRDYFKMWLGDENTQLTIYQLNNLNDIFDNNGVYYMHFIGEEDHYWVWIINNEIIWYAGTYGGVCNIIVKSFDKNNYGKRFIKALDGSMNDYSYVFQLDNPEVNRVNYKSINYMKSNRY